jgi:hypothetical protein
MNGIIPIGIIVASQTGIYIRQWGQIRIFPEIGWHSFKGNPVVLRFGGEPTVISLCECAATCAGSTPRKTLAFWTPSISFWAY